MANGLFAGGTGILGDPFLIEDAHDLNAIRNNLAAHYKLINDIDLNVAPYNEGGGWIPISIGSGSVTLDGDGHKVSRLYINRPATSSQGLFGLVGGNYPKIKNLSLIDVNITGGVSCGALVSNGAVLIDNCSATGVVNGGALDVGGLVGRSTLNSIIKNCYSMVSVSGENDLGGVVGRGNNSSAIVNCYSVGSVTGTGIRSGGLTGYLATPSLSKNSFWNTETSGKATSATGTGLSTQQMQTAQTFRDAGWDLELNDEGNPVWTLEDGRYPKLWFEVEFLFLIKSNNKIHTLSKDGDSVVYANLQEPLTQADYEKWGMNGLVGYENEIDKVLVEMDEDGELEDGRVVRKLVNKNEFRINRIEVTNK